MGKYHIRRSDRFFGLIAKAKPKRLAHFASVSQICTLQQINRWKTHHVWNIVRIENTHEFHLSPSNKSMVRSLFDLDISKLAPFLQFIYNQIQSEHIRTKEKTKE